MRAAASKLDGQQTLDMAFDGLEREVPPRVRRGLKWLRSPPARWLRVPLGLLLVAASMFWFLPIIGIELLPLGLLVIAQDAPFLRRPVGLVILWLLARWLRFKGYLHRRKRLRLR